MPKIFEIEDSKVFQSPEFSYVFNKSNGILTTFAENDFCPYGPVVIFAKLPNNFTFELFKRDFDKLPEVLTQISFEFDAFTNEVWKILAYTKDNGIIPSVTISPFIFRPEFAFNLSEYCPSVAVKFENDWKTFYNCINELNNNKIEYINIHCSLSSNIKQWNLLDSWYNLQNMAKSIVFQTVLHKSESIFDSSYKEIVYYCIKNSIPFGADLCGTIKLKKICKDFGLEIPDEMLSKCDAGLSSLYYDTIGFKPCKYSNDYYSIDVFSSNFIQDIWLSPKFEDFREKQITSTLNCEVN